MKVLMFGWEFPPHISGGLGTACYGLTKGLSKIQDVEILFVVPKSFGDEENSSVKLIGASEIDSSVILQQTGELQSHGGKEIGTEVISKLRLLEIKSLLHPYLSENEFDEYLKNKNLKPENFQITQDRKIFYKKEGKYSELNYDDLNSEIKITKEPFHFTGKYGSNLMTEVSNFAKVAAYLGKKYEFDIIHAHDWLTYPAGIVAKQISGKPLVIHVHATEFDRVSENQINPTVFETEKAGMEYADKIITVSNLTKHQIINHYGAHLAEKITTVYNGVEPDKNENRQYSKNGNHRIVTFLGRITYQKGPEYFIQAACKVLEKVEKVSFVMAGNGDMFRSMIKFASQRKIMKHFFFTDFLKGEEVSRMYALSDVYVMPSISEPFGISPLEAMRFGVPVIISKQSGVAEVLDEAIKVDYWDVDALADAIYGVLNYPALSENLKKSKQNTDKLSWDMAAMQVSEIYREALLHFSKN
jgi:glycosyltransferase involved in cell wall biosynthesis